MQEYLIQFTPEGGENGTRVVLADELDFQDNGAVIFSKFGNVVAAFSKYEVVVAVSELPDIMARTDAFQERSEQGD